MTWTAQSVGAGSWYGVWGFDPTHVYIVGAGGSIQATSDGTNWAPEVSGTMNTLRAIWGSDATHLYSVGDQGTILRSVNGGMGWMGVAIANRVNLTSWWGKSGDFFVAGLDGLVLHSPDNFGLVWNDTHSPSASALNGVWASHKEDLFVVGASSTVLHSIDLGMTWSMQTIPNGGTLSAVWGSGPGDVYIAGQLGAIFHLQ